ncbi:MAG: hypothetical protein HKN28_16490 [Alphaproteobacteria bacterium]|nr:hypothetical protein [Alphaproteobacteria bacterium]
MKRSTQFATVVLLAGVAQVSLASESLAQNIPWRFSSEIDPLTDKAGGSATAATKISIVDFSCVKGEPIGEFLVLVDLGDTDVYSKDELEVAWRTDNNAVRNEIWEANKVSVDSVGVGVLGQKAFDFALAVAGAQNRIVFRNPNGTLVYDAKGSTKAISQLLEFCGLKQ